MSKGFLAGALLCALEIGVVPASGAGSPAGFKTSRPPQLVATAPGVVIDPILSAGDTVGRYQMTGIPDGLGAYSRGGRLEIFMNHELDGPAVAPNAGARVSHLTLNQATRGVLRGKYPITGREGFVRFCSSTLDFIEGRPWYFTGEEDIPTNGHGGSSIAMDARTGAWVETPHFGYVLHENIVPVQRLSRPFFLTTDDDFREDPAHAAYLYAYIARSWSGAIAGTEGSLYVWKANGAADSTADISRGQTLQGRFVPITQAENANGDTLEAASAAKGGFKFTRLEDAAVSPQGPGVVYFDDTGRLGGETVKGRLYKLQIDSKKSTRASVKLLLDGDGPDDLVNPDNLGTSGKALVIQEDRNSEHRGSEVSGGYGRVLVYDFGTGDLRPVARVNTPATLRPGTWESSGAVSAETFFGDGWWLMDVQAHGTTAPQPGPTLAPNSATGEDGQLMAVYIPGT
jgi:hypothetical protein